MMRMTGFRRVTLVAFAYLFAAVRAVAAPACTATSGENTAALVELYTSEGCSSCPPADAWLRDVPRHYRSDQLVPLALHVPYWDDLGWKDAFGQTVFAQRQSWLVGLNRHRTVYTPQFFVSGMGVRDWQRTLEAEVRRINISPAAARIAVSASLSRGDTLTLASEAAISTSGNGQLFLAITEDGLTSDVRAGENRGAELRHDHVVRTWLGPLAMSDGKIADHREISLDSRWQVSRLGIVAFVQDGNSGRVLQAVTCALGW
ncbi:MAG TPA: DUF1223 domain-containing protein [Rhodocyclaceae bacterium]|nr:DUF1223 domain-containing protein [Rhodocyclaceae bacterium]